MRDKDKVERDKLMRLRTQVVLSNGEKVWLRTLGAYADEIRSQEALAASQKMRADLRDKGSEAYRLSVAPLLSLSREEKVEVATVLNRLQRTLEVARTIPTEEPLEPEDDTLEALEEHEKAKREAREQAEKRRMEKMEELTADFRRLVEAASDHDLDDTLTALQVTTRSEGEWFRVWEAYTLYMAVYEDEKCKRPFFSDPHEVVECHPDMYDALRRAYYELDALSREPGRLNF